MMLVQFGSQLMYPMPAELDPGDPEQLRQWVSTLPIGAFLFVLASHFAGTFAAGLACQLVARQPWPLGALIVGTFFTLGGILNLIAIPHPTWFAIVDLMLFFPAAWLGMRLGLALGVKNPPSSTS